VNDFCDFLAGKTDALIRELERKMQAASEEFDFERAARLRDDIAALRKAMEKQAVVLGDGTDADVIAFAQDELEAAVQIFHVRGGRVRGQRGWVIDKVEETETAGLVGQFLSQFYGEQAALAEQADAGGSPVPREVLVPELPGDATALSEWLSRLRGSRVNLRVPRRGDKRALAGTVERNASEAFAQHKLRRAGDLTARSAALQELADQLGLEAAPLRIECVDVSHVQGSDVVAALVVFEDGMPRKSEYRRFAIREGAAGGDVGSIEEVTRRRFTNYLTGDAGGGSIDRAGEGGAPRARNRPGGTESSAAHQPGIDPETGKAKKFAYPPNLYVVDGGAPQVEAAHDVLTGLGVTDVAVIGLAKRLEEVWVPAEIDPLVLPRASEALYLLQRVRDEAHRFAITYHRAKRGKRMSRSALDDVPGLGQTRKTALLKHFGSLRKIRDADLEQLTAVPGVGRSTAEALQAALAPEPAGQPGRDADDQAHCTEPESTSGEIEETSG
jgi:excinuclease ABC subunit C